MSANIIYLHGFASSPGSSKAAFLRKRLAEKGLSLIVPDLNVPDFYHLTLTAMIEKAAATVQACPDGPVYLIGSSMGGLVASHFVDRMKSGAARRVKKMVLLAPAFDFLNRYQQRLGQKTMQKWRETGELAVYHYAYREERPLSYALIEDLAQYDDAVLEIDIPVLVFHGQHDESVDVQQSVHFAENRDNVMLRMLDSDHKMLDQLNTIWMGIQAFFEL
jgi:hypothetical protein